MDTFWPSSAAGFVTTTAIAITALLFLTKTSVWPSRAKVLPSPLKTVLPYSSQEELKHLVYQPDQFPGARDIQTPYGSVRVYEFGPEDGEKVLCIHGISTSCVTLGRIASGLAQRGCRVMLYDLFGRGFSDGVGDLPHDERLYISQILLVLASSPLAWTGPDARLKVVGYSLGGGIAVHLSNALPHLVESLVLLAPAGLISAEKFGVVTNIVFKSGLVPEKLLAVLTKRRLQRPIGSRARKTTPTVQVIEVAALEASDPLEGKEDTPLEHRVMTYVRWMVNNHTGFVPAFMSCIRHAPLTEQHDSWRQLAKRKEGSTAVLLAHNDEIIDREAYTRDALPLVGGEGRVSWKVLPGGHDFVMTHAQEILTELEQLWGLE